jgi:hypothetical protein
MDGDKAMCARTTRQGTKLLRRHCVGSLSSALHLNFDISARFRISE